MLHFIIECTGRLKLEKLQTIAHETIYQWIYSATGQKLRLYQHLMYARSKRQQQYSRKHRYKIADLYKISNRPEVINTCAEFGHFEGDLTFFKGSKNGNIAVLAERKSCFSFLMVNNCKRSGTVIPKIVKCLKQLPPQARKSITFDNGGEFSQFGLLSLIGTKTYFCKPGAPWQKGQVERTNAQLHKFIPKKSNFNSISEKMAIDAQYKLNNLPRKCLGFLTPTEVYDNHLHNSVALHS
jgi:IS30 family transposase